MTIWTTKEVENALMDALGNSLDDNCKVETYQEANMMTRDNGIVLTMPNGKRFALGITRIG